MKMARVKQKEKSSKKPLSERLVKTATGYDSTTTLPPTPLSAHLPPPSSLFFKSLYLSCLWIVQENIEKGMMGVLLSDASGRTCH